MVGRLEHENWTLARAAGALGDRTNGKAERFIRTMLGGWACGANYGSSKKHLQLVRAGVCPELG